MGFRRLSVGTLPLARGIRHSFQQPRFEVECLFVPVGRIGRRPRQGGHVVLSGSRVLLTEGAYGRVLRRDPGFYGIFTPDVTGISYELTGKGNL